MKYGRLQCKKTIAEKFSNSASLGFGCAKLIIAVIVITIYSILLFKYNMNSSYIPILILTIVMEGLITAVFVVGYKGTKVIYLSWYYFTNFLFLAMKLSILILFVYFLKSILMAPYCPMILLDLILLYTMNKELDEHKEKSAVRFEFVNKLADHGNIINIMVPNNEIENVYIHGMMEADNNTPKKNEPAEFIETEMIAVDN